MSAFDEQKIAAQVATLPDEYPEVTGEDEAVIEEKEGNAVRPARHVPNGQNSRTAKKLPIRQHFRFYHGVNGYLGVIIDVSFLLLVVVWLPVLFCVVEHHYL